MKDMYGITKILPINKFRATFRFDLTNLRIEADDDHSRDDDEEITEWEVFLNPGET